MQITAQTLALLAGTNENDNMRSTLAGLQRGGVGAGLERPHRLAMYLGQLSHESAGWKYDREIWGPTEAQKRYDTRTDLGNTAAADGDGGHIQDGTARVGIKTGPQVDVAAIVAVKRQVDGGLALGRAE